MEIIIWVHLAAAMLALGFGLVNLLSVKGTPRHRRVGWTWLALMIFVTVSSFWIRELNDGDFSWIHLLTLWTLLSMVAAVVAIRLGKPRVHAGLMISTMIGVVVAGGFALLPGRFISRALGYG